MKEQDNLRWHYSVTPESLARSGNKAYCPEVVILTRRMERSSIECDPLKAPYIQNPSKIQEKKMFEPRKSQTPVKQVNSRHVKTKREIPHNQPNPN